MYVPYHHLRRRFDNTYRISARADSNRISVEQVADVCIHHKTPDHKLCRKTKKKQTGWEEEREKDRRIARKESNEVNKSTFEEGVGLDTTV